MSKAHREADRKAKLLIEYVQSNRIEGSFRVKGGLCFDYDKYVYGSIAQMKVHETLCLYWKTAYMRLYELKKIIEGKELT